MHSVMDHLHLPKSVIPIVTPSPHTTISVTEPAPAPSGHASDEKEKDISTTALSHTPSISVHSPAAGIGPQDEYRPQHQPTHDRSSLFPPDEQEARQAYRREKNASPAPLSPVPSMGSHGLQQRSLRHMSSHLSAATAPPQSFRDLTAIYAVVAAR